MAISISTFLINSLEIYGILTKEGDDIRWTDNEEAFTFDTILTKLMELSVHTNTVVEFQFNPHKNICWSSRIVPLYEKIKYSSEDEDRLEIERLYGIPWDDLPKHAFAGVWKHPEHHLSVSDSDYADLLLQIILCLAKLRDGDLAFSM